MALESAQFISQLNTANPTSTDAVSQADDHLRLIKAVLQNTFPNLNGPVTATPALLNAPIPSGVICMWSGSIATIPTGWVLCNGSNGTPDLRNRFIVGAGSTYTQGNTGGSATQTLAVDNLPAHTHTGTTDSNGAHTHTITDPGHTHTYTAYGSGSSGSQYFTPASQGTFTTNTGTSSTGITISAATAHTHTFTTSSVGSGAAFSILPPYYALAYIMKT